MKLEDKNNGELFAKCPIDSYPGIALESVADSSRYFVVRIQDDNGEWRMRQTRGKIIIWWTFSGRTAFIGLGFGDRSDSFDLNVALQDHFKWVKKEKQISEEPVGGSGPKLDLQFKEGETIKINMKITVSFHYYNIFSLKQSFFRKKTGLRFLLKLNHVPSWVLVYCRLHPEVENFPPLREAHLLVLLLMLQNPSQRGVNLHRLKQGELKSLELNFCTDQVRDLADLFEFLAQLLPHLRPQTTAIGCNFNPTTIYLIFCLIYLNFLLHKL